MYESREKIILVMEYASGGELYDYLNRMKRIPESQARAIFRQIVSAVHFLHKVTLRAPPTVALTARSSV